MTPDISRASRLFLAKANPSRRFRIGQGAAPQSRSGEAEAYSGRAVRSRATTIREAERAALDDDDDRDHPRVYRAGGPRVPLRDSLSLAAGQFGFKVAQARARQG